jgi:hypothetical protein
MEKPEQPDAMNRTSSGFLLLSLVLMIIFIIAVLMPVEPSDFWTYLRIGQEILTTHHIPTVEFMTYTRAGQPAVFSYWLASIGLLWIYKTGGLLLTALVTGAVVSGMYVFLWLCLRRFGVRPGIAGVLLLITALAGSNNWSTRPQIFAYPLFGLVLWILVRWQQKDNRLLWLLPIAAVLWVNLHGSFLLFFLMLSTALVFGAGNRKRLGVILLVSMAASFINPFGLGIWTNTWKMVGNIAIKEFSFEWFPPANKGWQMNLFFAYLLITPVLVAFAPRKPHRLLWVWFMGFGWMALSSTRYVIWFTIIEALVLGGMVESLLAGFAFKKPMFTNKVLNLTLGICLLCLSLLFLPGIRGRWWKQAPPALTDTTPVQAVEWLKAHPELPGPQWSNWVASIYMTYALPERKVWITNRVEDFPEEQLLDNKKLMRAEFDWQAILDRYGVNLLLLDQKYDAALLGAVAGSASWQQVYENTQSMIFTRTGK